MKQYIIYENIGDAYGFVHLVAEYVSSVSQSSIYMTVTILVGRSWTSMVDYAW
jgi:hypothetical protein